MISEKTAVALVKILNITEEPLEQVSQKFNNSFDFNEKLSAITGTTLLLTDGLLSTPQQIVAVWLLFSEFKDQPIKNHPFQSVFTSLLISQQLNPLFISPQLREILISILNDNGFGPADNQTVSVILSASFSFPQQKEPTIDKSNQTAHRISPVMVSQVQDPKLPQITHEEVLVKILTNDTFWSNFEAPFIRPCPEISPLFPGELEPIQSFAAPEFLFDTATNSSAKTSVYMYLAKSAEQKLKANETNMLIKEFRKDPSMFDEDKFPFNRFTSLIENNIDIAKEIVVTLGAKKQQIQKILQTPNITVNATEVVKHFLTNADVPPDFLLGYVRNTIKFIVTIRDQQTMARKTRIFAKAMCYLHDNKVEFAPPVVAELKTFCEDERVRSIKEVQELLVRL